MAHDAPPLPCSSFNLFQLHWLADQRKTTIQEVRNMPERDIRQYFYYYEEIKRLREQESRK